MMRPVLVLLASLFALVVHAQDVMKSLVLGDSVVDLVMYRSGKPGPLYFNMHDDENTSVHAAKGMAQIHGGDVYELRHSGLRYIRFHVDSTLYEIDPNRMYTDAGVWHELKRVYVRDSIHLADSLHLRDSLRIISVIGTLFSAEDSLVARMLRAMDIHIPLDTLLSRDSAYYLRRIPAHAFNARDSLVFDMVRGFADSLLTSLQIDSQQLVIALHNNTANNYGVNSYMLDSVYEKDALAIYQGYHPDPDEFYFVTTRRLFEALQPNEYHIVLQDNTRMTDDGSLSVYCARHGINYVNIEAQHGHEAEQRRMIEVLLERLGYW